MYVGNVVFYIDYGGKCVKISRKFTKTINLKWTLLKKYFSKVLDRLSNLTLRVKIYIVLILATWGVLF